MMAEVLHAISLRRLRQDLESLLRSRGREDLARDALDGIRYTDDGTTLYVHIFPNPMWPHRRLGQAYVLAFVDHGERMTLMEHRDLLREAWLLLQDEIDDIIKWFDGR